VARWSSTLFYFILFYFLKKKTLKIVGDHLAT
jgi:hypothetical protein